jgi:thioredoxin-related protein
MKYFISVFLLITTLFSAELDWEHNYYKALYDAKQQGKDVYLFIGADVCRWCDKFKKETLSDKNVIKRLKKDYILLYMSRDRHKIPNKFKVKGVPWQYFLDYKGKILFATQGSREIDGFYDLLEEVELSNESD